MRHEAEEEGGGDGLQAVVVGVRWWWEGLSGHYVARFSGLILWESVFGGKTRFDFEVGGGTI